MSFSLPADGDNYAELLLANTNFIDVRAPIEFHQGAFPHAINLPLIDDRERQAVGTCYKKQGQQAAIELGHQLVSGTLKQLRIDAWIEQVKQTPNAYLYCFRGGMRSQIAQQWLAEAGVLRPRVKGGYKALRQFLIQTTEQAAELPQFIVAGNTGCGKTLLINELDNGIDLEGHAHHRGSSFGRTLTPQLRQIDFENQLAITLLRKMSQQQGSWVLEDESKIIGSNHIPLPLYESMQKAEIAVIDDPFEVRLSRLQYEYIDHMHDEFSRVYGEDEGWEHYKEYLYHGLHSIRKRLGLERFAHMVEIQNEAFSQQLSRGFSDAHRAWLIPLLEHYYDPMYTYQLDKKRERISFTGDYAAVKAYLMAKTAEV